MNILVVGGDGFCGWPTSLELLSKGHRVLIADNLLRRKIDVSLNTNSLTDLKSLDSRVVTAKSLISNDIDYTFIDVAENYNGLVELINVNNIDTIVHFGEIRSAPYSMIDREKSRETINNNVNSTSNVLNAIVESGKDIHLIHLGTMGVYGYKDDFGKIPEGYLDVTVKSTGKDTSILFPTDPGSVYHMTKSIDQLMFQFYNKNWEIKITDLHQGIVWGTQTALTNLHENFVNRFDYDGIYGTVLNRFIVESVINHPLTVYGTGGQRRAFIHIEDTAECIRRVVENPPTEHKVRIFNQVSEVRGVRELADIVSSKTGVEVHFIENPRKEKSQNDLYVENTGLTSLGFKPKLLNDSLIDDLIFVSQKYKDKILRETIDGTWSRW